MLIKPKALLAILKETGSSWMEANSPRLGAALAYYTVFAMAPLFLITLRVSALWFGQEAAQHQLFGQLQSLLGTAGGKAMEAMITSAANQPSTGFWATCLATGTLLVAATGVFVELQDALNTIWKIKRIPGHGFVRFVKDRLLSFAMIVGIGFLLLVSLVISAGMAAFGQFVSGHFSEHMLWVVVNFSLSLALITVLFAMIFKVLPDVKIAWRDVWLGGFVTALLFNLGKFLLGFYLGRNSVTSAYGAAGSLVILLLWVYYSAQILFFGAELTRVCADHFGSHLEAAEGAELLEEVKITSRVNTPRRKTIPRPRLPHRHITT